VVQDAEQIEISVFVVLELREFVFELRSTGAPFGVGDKPDRAVEHHEQPIHERRRGVMCSVLREPQSHRLRFGEADDGSFAERHP
jgi:hypothetical protein